jgi:hypothetical protein
MSGAAQMQSVAEAGAGAGGVGAGAAGAEEGSVQWAVPVDSKRRGHVEVGVEPGTCALEVSIRFTL